MKKLIGACGLDCEECEARIATINNDDELRARVAKEWSELNQTEITPDMINCLGCRSDGVKTPYCESLCEIRKCALGNSFETCGDCKNLHFCENVAMIIGNNMEARNRVLGYQLVQAKKYKELFVQHFVDYCNELALMDESLLDSDYNELAEECFMEENHPYMIFTEDGIVGFVIFQDVLGDVSDDSCYTYIHALFIKKEYRNKGIATKLVLEYLATQEHDTGLYYIVGGYSEKFWLTLLDDSGFPYDVYKEDDSKNFIHIHLV